MTIHKVWVSMINTLGRKNAAVLIGGVPFSLFWKKVVYQWYLEESKYGFILSLYIHQCERVKNEKSGNIFGCRRVLIDSRLKMLIYCEIFEG